MMEKNDYLVNVIGDKRGKQYDVAICYSGGKDSSFLIYLLKEVYNLRVIAISVDNGFEFTNSEENIKCFPQKVGVPVETIKPNGAFFSKLYHSLIVTPGSLNDGKRNHVCHICNNMLWCQVMLYASEHGIPFVASGLGLEQLNSGRSYPMEINQLSNRIAEKSTKRILRMALDYFHENEELMTDEAFVHEVSRIENIGNGVTTLYPYIYHQISINDQKCILQEYGQWHPPIDIDTNKYISSGCLIMTKVIHEMEKLEMVVLNEREEAKRMNALGLIEADQIEFAYRDVKNKKVSLEDPIFDELNIKEYLMDVARRRNQI